jgi:2'-5' RNA ligase
MKISQEPTQGNRIALPEYTTVAFLGEADMATFRKSVEHFPRTSTQQLPPHITILNMVFSREPVEAIERSIEDAIKTGKVSPFTVRTNGLLVWHNSRYKGYTIAAGIEPNQDLLNFRSILVKRLRPITIPEEESVWSDYAPHITISLSVSIEEAKIVRTLPSLAVMEFRLDTIRLLRHGGNYFGYTRESSFRLPNT